MKTLERRGVIPDSNLILEPIKHLNANRVANQDEIRLRNTAGFQIGLILPGDRVDGARRGQRGDRRGQNDLGEVVE